MLTEWLHDLSLYIFSFPVIALKHPLLFYQELFYNLKALMKVHENQNMSTFTFLWM